MNAAILLSRINMYLRDDESLTLEDVCASLGLDRDEVQKTLSAAGYTYDEEHRKFY